jgi:hypothetical protein
MLRFHTILKTKPVVFFAKKTLSQFLLQEMAPFVAMMAPSSVATMTP